MKTISPKRHKSFPIVTLVAGAAVLLVCASVVLWRDTASSAFWYVAQPLIQLRNALGATESAELRGRVATLEAQVRDRAALYLENLDLKSRLGRNAEVSVILAAVLQRPPGTPYDSFIIDAGSSAGLLEGQLVSAGGNALIGRVGEVSGKSARVVLFSAPGLEHQALIERAGRSITLSVVGEGAGAMVAQVPAGTGARVGDRILFPGIHSAMSAEVSHVELRQEDAFEKVYLHLPANIFELRFVEIWR